MFEFLAVELVVEHKGDDREAANAARSQVSGRLPLVSLDMMNAEVVQLGIFIVLLHHFVQFTLKGNQLACSGRKALLIGDFLRKYWGTVGMHLFVGRFGVMVAMHEGSLAG